MSTVVIAFLQAYPPTCGSGQVSFNVAKHTSGQKHLMQSVRPEPKEFCVNGIQIYNLGHLSENKVRKTIQVCKQSYGIARMLSQIRPDVIILEGATSLYCLIAFSAIRMRGWKSRVIYHAHNVEYILRQERRTPFYARVAKWSEGVLIRKTDLTFAVSKIDAANFEKIYSVRTEVLPNSVDIDSFTQVTPEQIRAMKDKYGLSGKTVLFMCLPSYPPNKEALAFLINRVFPSVVDKCPEARLAIIGGKVQYEREWLTNPGRIPFEDLPPFLKASDVCVAPIFIGSGTRVKILEYLGAGKPVVATAKAAEGIEVKHNETIILAETPQEQIDGIHSLLENPELAKRLGSQAFEFVKSKHSWKTNMERFESILASMNRKGSEA